jgi:phage terminase large subunit-like protein
VSLAEHAPHVALAIQYAEDVIAGEFACGKYEILACKRFMLDLEKENAPWHFDTEAAERPCRYIERLPHVKGEWAKRRELLTLEPWQCFNVCNVFGWLYSEDVVDENGDTVTYANTRRFSTAYTDVGRKNAKTTLAAGIGLYMLDEDGEAGAEVYSAATTRNQAKIVFSIANTMAKRTAELPLEVRAHNIHKAETASLFEALHAQGNTLDGYNIHCSLNDELHAWKNRDVYNVIETATGARQQPLIYNITTAGHDTSGICYELRTYLTRILEGQIEDESFFGVIYSLDKDDDWTDRDVWRKANPNWNVSVYPMDIENLCRKATEVVSQVNAFLTKRMNVWVNAAEAWMDMRKWEACRDSTMKLEDFEGEDTFAGLDLASKIDVNSMAQLFERTIDGKQHVFCFMRHWLPETAVLEDPNAQYDGWVRAGQMRTTQGNVIDVDAIEAATLEEVNGIFNLRELAVDPMHNSTQYGVHMAQQGILVVDVRPTVLNFSEPMKWLEAYVKDGTFHHNCPVLTWMVSNVEVKRDQKDNIYPRKGAANRKIDGVVALLMALNRLRAQEATYFPGEGVVKVI